jgi:hypothetical protein
MTTDSGTPLAKVSSLSTDGTQLTASWLNGSEAVARSEPADGPDGPPAVVCRARGAGRRQWACSTGCFVSR